MAEPIVSVVMPVLRPHPLHFRAAVVSVLQQTLSDLELVIVEDPSDRSGRELLRGLDDPRIRHFENPARTSLVDQRNRALAECRAELVAMLDADDIAEPTRLATQRAYLAEHPDIGVVGTALTIIDDASHEVGSRSYPLDHDAIVAAMARYNAIAQPSVMTRRSILRAAGDYQYRTFPVNEDYELWSRLAKGGVRFANLPERLVRYRIHPGGTKAVMLHRMLRATIDVKRLWWIDQMDMRARLRFYSEHVLLGLPASWVLKLFLVTQAMGDRRR